MADNFLIPKLQLGTSIATKEIDGVHHVVMTEGSIRALSGGQCQAVSISGTSAQSASITTGNVIVTPTVDCYFRASANPTALSDGTDQLLLGGVQYRIVGIASGHKLAFKTTGATGTAHIAPGA